MPILRCFLLFLLLYPATVSAFDLAELIRKVEQQYNGDSSEIELEMTIKTGHWERQLKMESWSLGRERFLVRILAPAKEKGVATLKVDREVWNYLPKVDRVIRIPPSMMGGAWMGSHITNDDLVKANHIDEDYDFTLLEEDERRWVIEGIPKPEAAVIWGKIIYRLQKEPLVPIEVEYFDEEDVLVRRIVFDDVQAVSGRTIPLRMQVLPVEKPEEKTIMHYRKVKFDIDLQEEYFSLGRLKGRR
ncbi:Outer membrane lipoprotein-sorting protein [Malonomonas rubra DSM 5091]|uniref:Outer membrane lipoprotein-sorting protein n=1 Tax=Malonomonas rubra DSM 5091 TaxID=1122189 RepID=A0A1M6DWE4_MALRU|nr:outer membrane lipoprotein-sorting protein [Malonomonas rubra]SHI77522.1 Outer membrane lipoprotein-sorting protein [Malonomonas rubra DSM 5091]